MRERQDITERIEREKERFGNMSLDKLPALNDLEEELLKALRYVIVARKIKCEHKTPAPDAICARCIADAAIEKAERVRNYVRAHA